MARNASPEEADPEEASPEEGADQEEASPEKRTQNKPAQKKKIQKKTAAWSGEGRKLSGGHWETIEPIPIGGDEEEMTLYMKRGDRYSEINLPKMTRKKNRTKEVLVNHAGFLNRMPMWAAKLAGVINPEEYDQEVLDEDEE